MRPIGIFLLALMTICFSRLYGQVLGPGQMALINPVALGIRISPDGGGLTGKFFLDRNLVIEAQVSGSQGYLSMPHNGPGYGPGWSGTGLLEYHFIFHDPSWRIYAGAGLHVGKWDKYDHSMNADAPMAEGIFGADAILGAEYLLRPVPIGISLDAKPAVNIYSYSGFFPNNIFGLSVRYYFGRKIVVRVENEENMESPAAPGGNTRVLK